jgi:hypothetical protein
VEIGTSVVPLQTTDDWMNGWKIKTAVDDRDASVPTHDV